MLSFPLITSLFLISISVTPLVCQDQNRTTIAAGTSKPTTNGPSTIKPSKKEPMFQVSIDTKWPKAAKYSEAESKAYLEQAKSALNSFLERAKGKIDILIRKQSSVFFSIREPYILEVKQDLDKDSRYFRIKHLGMREKISSQKQKYKYEGPSLKSIQNGSSNLTTAEDGKLEKLFLVIVYTNVQSLGWRPLFISAFMENPKREAQKQLIEYRKKIQDKGAIVSDSATSIMFTVRESNWQSVKKELGGYRRLNHKILHKDLGQLVKQQLTQKSRDLSAKQGKEKDHQLVKVFVNDDRRIFLKRDDKFKQRYIERGRQDLKQFLKKAGDQIDILSQDSDEALIFVTDSSWEMVKKDLDAFSKLQHKVIH